MAKKINPDEIQQLIDMGKEKGFLTYDEVNDMLPANMVSSEQLEDVMSMFGEMDIEIVESEDKATNAKEEDSEEDEREVEITCAAGERTNPRLRYYP